MKAGRELDALVAEKVMGWERRNESWYDEEGVEATRFISPDGIESTCYGWSDDCSYDELDDTLPHYSTDIAAAWQVVEKLHNSGYAIQVYASYGGLYIVDVKGDIEFGIAEADTAPLAICLAALKAIAE